MADKDFNIKKGLNVRDGKLIVNENETTIDGVAIADEVYVDGADATLQSNIDVLDGRVDTLEDASPTVLVDASGAGDYLTINEAVDAGHFNININPGTYPITQTINLDNGRYEIVGVGEGVILELTGTTDMFGWDTATKPYQDISYIFPVDTGVDSINVPYDTITDGVTDFTTAFTVGQKWSFGVGGIKRQLGLYEVVGVVVGSVTFDRTLPLQKDMIVDAPDFTMYRMMQSGKEFYMNNIAIGGTGTGNPFLNEDVDGDLVYFDRFLVENCDITIAGQTGLVYDYMFTSSDNLHDVGFVNCSIKSAVDEDNGWYYYAGYMQNCYLEGMVLQSWSSSTDGIDNCTLNNCEITQGVFASTQLDKYFNTDGRELYTFTNNKLVECTAGNTFNITYDSNGDVRDDIFTFAENSVTNFSGTIGGLTDSTGYYKEINSSSPVLQEGGENINHQILVENHGVLHVTTPDDANSKIWMPDPLNADSTQRPERHDGKTYKILFSVHDEYGVDYDEDLYIMFPNSSAPDSFEHPTEVDYVGEIASHSISSYGTYSGTDGWKYEDVLGGSGTGGTLQFRVVGGTVQPNSVSWYARGMNYLGFDTVTISNGFSVPMSIDIDIVRNRPTQCILLNNNGDTPYFEFTYTRTHKVQSASFVEEGNARSYPDNMAYTWAIVNSNRGYQEAKMLSGLDAIVSVDSSFNTKQYNNNADSSVLWSQGMAMGDTNRWSPIGTFQTIEQALAVGKRHIGVVAGEHNNLSATYYTIVNPIIFENISDDFSLTGFSRDGSPVKVSLAPLAGVVKSVDTIISGGHTDGLYYDVALTDVGAGSGVKANIEVVGGDVINIIITDGGQNYTNNDVLAISSGTIGGTVDATCQVAGVTGLSDMFDWTYQANAEINEQILTWSTGTNWNYNTATKELTGGTGYNFSNLRVGGEVIFDDVYQDRRLGVYTVASILSNVVTFTEDLPILAGVHGTSATFNIFPDYISGGGGHSLTFKNIEFTINANVSRVFRTDNEMIFKKFYMEDCVWNLTENGEMFYDYLTPYNIAFCTAKNCIIKGDGNDALYGNLLYDTCTIQGTNILSDKDNEFVNCVIQNCTIRSDDFTATRPVWLKEGPYVRFTGNTLINCEWGTNVTDNYFDVTANDIVNSSGTTGTCYNSAGTFSVSFDRNLFVKDSIFTPVINVNNRATFAYGSRVNFTDDGLSGNDLLGAQFFYSGEVGNGGVFYLNVDDDDDSDFRINTGSTKSVIMNGGLTVSGTITGSSDLTFDSLSSMNINITADQNLLIGTGTDTGSILFGRKVNIDPSKDLVVDTIYPNGTTDDLYLGRVAGDVVAQNNLIVTGGLDASTIAASSVCNIYGASPVFNMSTVKSISGTEGAADTLFFAPAVVDGAGAIAYKFGTVNDLADAGAKIASFQNQTTEVMYIHDGGVDLAAGLEYTIDGVPVGGGGGIAYEVPVDGAAITAEVNTHYIVDTSANGADILMTMPSTTGLVVGDIIGITDMKGNFGTGGTKNVYTSSTDIDGATQVYTFDVANTTVQLVWTGTTVAGNVGWKSIIIQP